MYDLVLLLGVRLNNNTVKRVENIFIGISLF